MYNNYGYNPYMPQNRFIGVPQPQMPQPMPQNMPPTQMSVPSTNILSGKTVESIDVVKAMDIPMDGSISYFPIADGSAIVSKQMQIDGTSKTTIFKPFNEQKEEVRYITQEDMKKAIEGLDFSELDDIKEDIKDLRQEIKDLKKKSKGD